MLTSLAPSPIAKVMSFVLNLIKSTISALFFGVARQQITTWHDMSILKNFSAHCRDSKVSITFFSVRVFKISLFFGFYFLKWVYTFPSMTIPCFIPTSSRSRLEKYSNHFSMVALNSFKLFEINLRFWDHILHTLSLFHTSLLSTK